MIKIPKITCQSNSSNIVVLCRNPKCDKKAIICMKQSCQFCPSQQHQFCQFISAHSIQSQLTAKRSQITQNLQQVFDALQWIYNDAIRMIQQQRENMHKRKANYGLSQTQMVFLEKLNKQPELIRGFDVNQIRQNLQKKSSIQFITYKHVLSFWGAQKTKLSRILNQIKEVNKMSKYTTNFDYKKQLNLVLQKRRGKEKIQIQEIEPVKLVALFG